MWYLAVVGSVFALAAASEQPVIPEFAPAITTVKANQSYIVKLECVGCPFRVRERGEVVEHWQEPPQDNSLLLNFTIDNDEPGLLLNDERIAPLAPMPLDIYAYQIPANLSGVDMEEITTWNVLEKSWNVGMKFGRFELQYEHSTLVHNRNWIQFDITAVHQRSVHNPASKRLDGEGQKIVQVVLREPIGRPGVYIEDIQLVERKYGMKPYKMRCGKLAMIKSAYNPLEWDYYGKFGTLERTWHLVLWKSGDFFQSNALVFIVVAVVFGVVSLVRRRIRQLRESAVAQVKEDAEAVLLATEYDDAPPDYSDVPELEHKAEDI